MSQQLATLIYVIGIAALFYLDRDPDARISKGLWIPVIWLMICGSRPVSAWLHPGPSVTTVDQNMEGSPIDAAVFGVLALAGIIVLISRSRRAKTYLLANWPLVLFFLYCAISIAWSDFPFIAFKRWIKAIGDLTMVMVVLTDPDPLIAARKFFARVTFLLMPLSLLFIKYYPDLGRAYNPWTWTPMYIGVSTFKNLLGMICLVCGLSSLWSFSGAWRDKQMPYRFRHMAAHGAMVAMSIYLIETANSMTSLACLFMAGTLILIPVQKRWTARALVAQCLIWVAITASLYNLFSGSSSLLTSMGRDATLTGRTDIWKAVLAQRFNPITGTGFESFWMGYRKDQVNYLTAEKGIQEAHDGYLETYINLGLIGVILLGTIVFTGYRNALALFKREPHAGRLRLAFFTAAVIYSFTEAGFRILSPIWIGFLLSVAQVPAPRRRKTLIELPKSHFVQEAEKSLEPAGVLTAGSSLGRSRASARAARSRRVAGFLA